MTKGSVSSPRQRLAELIYVVAAIGETYSGNTQLLAALRRGNDTEIWMLLEAQAMDISNPNREQAQQLCNAWRNAILALRPSGQFNLPPAMGNTDPWKGYGRSWSKR